eukprot:IDg15729t1
MIVTLQTAWHRWSAYAGSSVGTIGHCDLCGMCRAHGPIHRMQCSPCWYSTPCCEYELSGVGIGVGRCAVQFGPVHSVRRRWLNSRTAELSECRARATAARGRSKSGNKGATGACVRLGLCSTVAGHPAHARTSGQEKRRNRARADLQTDGGHRATRRGGSEPI